MGIMGGKNKVVNIEIIGRKHFQYRSIFRRYFNLEATHFYKVLEDKEVYFVTLKNGSYARMDICQKNKKTLKKKTYYHKILNDYDLKFPKLFGVQETPDFVYKACEWIEGTRIGKVWSYPNMFKLAGEQIAKINMIKDPETEDYLTFQDFNKINAIWTEDSQLYLIGNSVESKPDVDSSVAKMLLKNMGDPERIKWFLKGYSSVRNCYLIQKIVEERNYIW